MSSSVSIIVKSLMSGGPGATTSIAVQPEDTIWQVKLKIAAKKDIAAVTQRLLFHGNVLRDELTVAYYELKHGSLVHLVVTAPKAGAAGPASASSPAGSATAAGAGAGAGVPAASAAAPAAAEKVEFKSSSSSESAGTAAGASSSDGSLTVRVHSEDGRTGSMQVQPSTKLADVRVAVARAFGVPLRMRRKLQLQIVEKDEKNPLGRGAARDLPKDVSEDATVEQLGLLKAYKNTLIVINCEEVYSKKIYLGEYTLRKLLENRASNPSTADAAEVMSAVIRPVLERPSDERVRRIEAHSVLGTFQRAPGFMDLFSKVGFLRREDVFELPSTADLTFARLALKMLDLSAGKFDPKSAIYEDPRDLESLLPAAPKKPSRQPSSERKRPSSTATGASSAVDSADSAASDHAAAPAEDVFARPFAGPIPAPPAPASGFSRAGSSSAAPGSASAAPIRDLTAEASEAQQSFFLPAARRPRRSVCQILCGRWSPRSIWDGLVEPGSNDYSRLLGVLFVAVIALLVVLRVAKMQLAAAGVQLDWPQPWLWFGLGGGGGAGAGAGAAAHQQAAMDDAAVQAQLAAEAAAAEAAEQAQQAAAAQQQPGHGEL